MEKYQIYSDILGSRRREDRGIWSRRTEERRTEGHRKEKQIGRQRTAWTDRQTDERRTDGK